MTSATSNRRLRDDADALSDEPLDIRRVNRQRLHIDVYRYGHETVRLDNLDHVANVDDRENDLGATRKIERGEKKIESCADREAGKTAVIFPITLEMLLNNLSVTRPAAAYCRHGKIRSANIPLLPR